MKVKTNSNAKKSMAVRIDDNIQTISANPAVFSSGIIQAILIVILTLSSLFVGMSFTGLDYVKAFPIFYCILLTCILCLLKSKAAALVTYAIVALATFKHADSIKRGFAIIVTEFLDIYKLSANPTIESMASINDGHTSSEAVTITLLAAISVLVVVLYITVYLKSNFMLTFIFTFPLPEIGIYNGIAPDYFWAFALIAAWVCVFTAQLCDYQENKRTNNSDFTPNRKSTRFYLTSQSTKRSAYGQLSAAICILITVALTLSAIGASIGGYSRSRKLDILRRHLGTEFSLESLMEALDEIRGIDIGLDFDFGSNYDSIFNRQNHAVDFGGMTMGSLRGNNNISFSGKTMLTIESDMPIEDTLYIKGFASGHYEDSQWHDTADGFSLFLQNTAWLGNGSYPDASAENFPQELATHFSTAESFVEQYAGNLSIIPLRITDVSGQSGLLFTPYFSRKIQNSDYRIVYDSYMKTADSTSDVICYLPDGHSVTDIYEKYPDYGYYLIYPYLIEHLSTYPQSGMTPYEHLVSSNLMRNYETGLNMLDCIKYIASSSDDNLIVSEHDNGNGGIFIESYNEPAGYEYSFAFQYDGSYSFDPLDPESAVLKHFHDAKSPLLYSDILTLEELVELAYSQYFGDESFKETIDSRFDYGYDTTYYTDYLFNYSEYFDVNIEIDERVLNYIDSNTSSRGCREIISALKNYFKEYYKYSLNVEATPDGEDFIEHFLSDMNSGSCTYFASAAVQILRYYGIPARYAEGFAMTPSEPVEKDGKYYYSVPDNSAHAWVEYYDFSLGWLPLEFTVSSQPSNNETSTTTQTTTTTTTTTTASPQTSPAVTTTPKNTATSQQTTSSAVQSVSEGRDYTALYIVIFSAAVIGIIALGYTSRRNRRLAELSDEITTDDANKNAVGLYRQALAYLSLLGITVEGNISDTVHAQRLKDIISQSQLAELEDKITLACEIAVAAKMGGQELSEEDILPLRDFHGFIKDGVFSKLTRFEKFSARFIKNLYR